MSNMQERSVNIIPTIRIKKEIVSSDDEDSEHCRLCSKTFANFKALANHASMEHEDVFARGDPAVWTLQKEPAPKVTPSPPKPKIKRDHKQELMPEVQIKTAQIQSAMKPTNITTLASKDVSYIIIKADDLPIKKKREKVEPKKVPQVAARREKTLQTITGPFECLQPSSVAASGACHQIFFSCCEYSAHYRDEHNRRRKALRCQVCEKPLLPDVEDKNNACELCGAGFDTCHELSAHMCVAHVKLKPFECNICHKRFTQQGGVQQHMRMHTGDRPFPCTFCTKAFTQKSGLDQHIRIHTRVKPYRCVVCGKTFCQSIHLKQHMRTHTNVSPFQCGICNKRFKQSSHLNYHLKNHNQIAMTDEQKEKYAELIGIMSKEIVEVEIDVNSELQYENVIQIEEEPDGSVDREYTTVMDGVETWCVEVDGS